MFLLINANVRSFFERRTEDILITDLWNTGLLRQKRDLLFASSPDGMAIMSVPSAPLNTDERCDTLVSIQRFLLAEKYGLTNVSDERITTVVSLEYKHKSSTQTVAKARVLAASLRSSNEIVVIPIDITWKDETRFSKYVPEIDYRLQVVHEALCSNTNVLLYVVASTKIEYVCILLFSGEFLSAYRNMLLFVQYRYLSWMFIPNEPDESETDVRGGVEEVVRDVPQPDLSITDNIEKVVEGTERVAEAMNKTGSSSSEDSDITLHRRAKKTSRKMHEDLEKFNDDDNMSDGTVSDIACDVDSDNHQASASACSVTSLASSNINEPTEQFDKSLKAMPKWDIKYGYAADRVTMKCRIQLMMSLYDLRVKLGHPIPPGKNLIPKAGNCDVEFAERWC
jgi:hypothetical protein